MEENCRTFGQPKESYVKHQEASKKLFCPNLEQLLKPRLYMANLSLSLCTPARGFSIADLKSSLPSETNTFGDTGPVNTAEEDRRSN